MPAHTLIFIWALLLVGCAEPGPRYFAVLPDEIEPLPDGGLVRHYQSVKDGLGEYHERLSPGGRIVALRFGGDEIAYPPAVDDAAHLIIILDSIPFELVRDMWNQGRFRYFHPPGRVISPFPAMTDPCIAEFFSIAPIPGVEASFYDGRKLTNGASSYLSRKNMPWTRLMDYYLPPLGHMFVYADPDPWFDHELGNIESHALPRLSQGDNFTAYVVSTSSLGSWFGRNGHQRALIRLDRFCQSIVRRTHGRVHITLLSDHGHNLVASRRLALADELTLSGYRVGDHLGPDVDVIVPEWGIVTCAAIYTTAPAAVAHDVVGFAGVELTAYLEADDRIVVVSRTGRARIERRGDRYRYAIEFGDPLYLQPTLLALESAGEVDSDGFVDDQAFFEATREHFMPDTVHRLWRAFHGLFIHTPDVFVSIQEGYHVGSDDINKRLEMQSTHGNLGMMSSSAFVMTTAGPLPDVQRMEDLAECLRALGVPVPSDGADAPVPNSLARGSAGR